MRLEKAKDKVLVVEFWDHVRQSEDLVYCVVSGRLGKINRDSITLYHWTSYEQEAKLTELEDNHDFMTIARSTIVRWSVFNPVRWHKSK